MNDDRSPGSLLKSEPVPLAPSPSTARARIHTAARAETRMRAVKSVAEWEDCYRAVRHPHLPQSAVYGHGKRIAEGWHVEHCVFEQGGTPLAICQVLEARIAGWCIVARINRGPMFLDDAPSFEEREAVMRLVRQRWRLSRGTALLIAPALTDTEENLALMRNAGFRLRKAQGWCSALVDLRAPEEEIRKRVASVWRNRLKAALKSGLALRVADDTDAFEWMLDRHQENMRLKRFSGPSKALLRALHQTGPQEFRLLQAMHEDKAVGGLILAHIGRAAEYYVGWFGEEGRKRNCGNFLYWHALCEARKAGHDWFDVGGYYSNDKFGHFKQNLRGAEYRLAGEWISL